MNADENVVRETLRTLLTAETEEKEASEPELNLYLRAFLELFREIRQAQARSFSLYELAQKASSMSDPSLLAEFFKTVHVGSSLRPSKKDELRIRGAVAFAGLLRTHGGTYSSEEVAQLLRITPDGVRKRERANRLLSISFGEHRQYPVWQFEEGRLKPGFEEVLAILNRTRASEVAKVRFFLTPSGDLGERPPVDALQDPENRALVLRMAEQFGEQGAQ